MPTTAWALLCHRVLLDDEGRLCLQSLIDSLTVPTLPILVREVTVVAKVANAVITPDLDVRIDIATPDGQWSVPADAEAMQLFVAGDVIVATIRSLPIAAHGVYRFDVSIGGQLAAAVELPVFPAAEPDLRVH